MEVVFLRKFSKDLDKIKKPKDLKSVAVIIELETTRTRAEVTVIPVFEERRDSKYRNLKRERHSSPR